MSYIVGYKEEAMSTGVGLLRDTSLSAAIGRRTDPPRKVKLMIPLSRRERRNKRDP
jgi:hypothetical protein